MTQIDTGVTPEPAPQEDVTTPTTAAPAAEPEKVEPPQTDSDPAADPATPPAEEPVVTPTIDEEEAFDPWKEMEKLRPKEGADKPAETPAADAPQSTPGGTETGDKPEGDEVPGETNEAAVRRILEAHKGDPGALAKALLKQMQANSRLGQRIGNLENPNSPAPVTPAVSATSSVATDSLPVPGTPPGTAVVPELPGLDVDPSEVYNPATAQVNPETGWLIGKDGEDAWALDEFGIEFIPNSYWTVRLRELEEEHDSAAVAIDMVNRERAEAQAEYSRELSQAATKAVNYHKSKTLPEEQARVAGDYTRYEEPVAKRLAYEICNQVAIDLEKAVTEGRITKAQLRDPATIKGAVETMQYLLYKNPAEEAKIIGQIRAEVSAKSAVPAVAGAAPIGVGGTLPPSGGTGVPPPPADITLRKVPVRVQEVASRTGLDADKVAKYSDKNFVIDMAN